MIFEFTKQGESLPMAIKKFYVFEEAVAYANKLHRRTGTRIKLSKRQDVVINGRQYYLHIGVY